MRDKASSGNESIATMAKLKVKVVPGASRSELSGWLGDMLKIRISAPPENGKANGAVKVFLAEKLGLPKSAIAITAGKSAQRKVIEIQGLSSGEVMERLGVQSA
jgi:hypothetical protein